jgi:DNA-binding NarL/FixJ family response regulator
MTLVVRNGDEIAGALSLVRDAASDDFSGSERALACTIAPVLGLAYAIATERQALARSAPGSSPPIEGIDALTPRERQVMQLVVLGHSNKVIARMLDASPWMIKNHLRAIFEKMQVPNRTALCARVGGGLAPSSAH